MYDNHETHTRQAVDELKKSDPDAGIIVVQGVNGVIRWNKFYVPAARDQFESLLRRPNVFGAVFIHLLSSLDACMKFPSGADKERWVEYLDTSEGEALRGRAQEILTRISKVS